MRYTDAVYAFLVAAAAALLLTPLAGRLARRVGAISYPSARGLARKPTPELGGLAILAGVLVAAAIWMPATIALKPSPHARPGSAGEFHTWAVLAGAALIALIGAIDDAIDLPPLMKLIGQIAAAVIAVRGGAVINDLTLPVGRVDRHHLGRADGGSLLARMIDDQRGALRHLAKMLHAGRIGHAIPDGLLVAHQIRERINIRLGLQ